MLILFLLRSKLEEWTRSHHNVTPTPRVITELSQAGGAAIRHAVVGKTAPQVIAAIAGLEVPFSVNVGIEGQLERGEAPARLPNLSMLEWAFETSLAWHRSLLVDRAPHLAGECQPVADSAHASEQGR